MFKKNKPICYILVYKEYEIIKESLDFFVTLSKYFDIVVIENPSNNTPQIKKLITAFGKSLKIRRYYLFEENITNNAYQMVLEKEIKKIEKCPYVVVSDGDLTIEDGDSWLKEALGILNYKEVFCCSAGILMDNLPLETFPEAVNWIPKLISTGPFDEGKTGCHLIMFRGKELVNYLKWIKKNKKFFVDGDIYDYCYKVLGKKWARTRENKIYHLTWDLYKDLDYEYTKLKTSKTMVEMWKHHNFSNFTLKEFF
ncbi:MAG TPA: hypothetical protein VFX86_04255 [Candidatus Saccharimonadales bacterium]|nr:hypothetical protein [Candidatus Saccharimonadales bacterium]